METKTYRVALIGAGMIANSAHIPAMLDMDGRFTLVGVQDVRARGCRLGQKLCSATGSVEKNESIFAEASAPTAIRHPSPKLVANSPIRI